MTRPFLIALFFASLIAPAHAEIAKRIVSINLCADQLVLLLAKREHVLSVSDLARDPGLSNVAEAARGIAVNYGDAEDILRYRPDVVVSGRFRQNATNRLLRRLGIRVVTIESPHSLPDVRKIIRTLAAELGVPERGRAVIADLDRRIAAAPLPPGPQTRKLRVANYQLRLGSYGRGSLGNDILERAGVINIAAELGIASFGFLPLETMIVANPDVLIMSDTQQPGASLADAILDHPVFRRLARTKKIIRVPAKYWMCAGPWVGEALRLVRRGVYGAPRP